MTESQGDTREQELSEFDPLQLVNYTSAYVRKLLAERPYIYARLYNQGGSIITQSIAADIERGEQYSSVIGSSIHNDLIELDQKMSRLPKGDQDALEAWANDLTPERAAQFLSVKGGKIYVPSSAEAQQRRAEAVRQRRSRAVKKLTSELNDDTEGIRGTRRTDDGASDRGSEASGHQSTENGSD